MIKGKAPVNLNLFSIAFPVGAVVSILHRLTGMLLFLVIPIAIYLLQYSLGSEEKFNQIQQLFSGWQIKFAALMLLWALLHHFFAGIRFLLLDLDIGLSRIQARNSAAAVLIASVMCLFLALWLI